MSYDLEQNCFPFQLYLVISTFICKFSTSQVILGRFLREIDIQKFSLFTFLLRLTLVTSSRVFPTTVVVVVVLVAGVEPAVEMATPLELLLILDDDDEDIGG